jgi:hypothetical protein
MHARLEVIQDADSVAFFEQQINGVGADEPRSTGDKNAHVSSPKDFSTQGRKGARPP